MLIVEVLESIKDVLRNANRPGVGQRAEVQTRAADHVGQQADIGRGEILAVQ